MLRHPRSYRLATMFSIMFATAFILISSIFYGLDYVNKKESLHQGLYSKASSILDFAGVLLESRNEKFFSGESPEIPQIIQNEVFDRFTEVSDGKVYYKEASDDPVTSKNKSTQYESEMIRYFIENRDQKEQERFVIDDGTEFFMLARPIISEQRCIMCHPNWVPDKVVAIEDVRIDATDYQEALSENIMMTLITAAANIILILVLAYYLFTHEVANRIKKVLEVIFRVENGNFVIKDLLEGEPIETGSTNNEIDRLFRHLSKMVNTLRPVIGNVVDQSKVMAFEASYGYVKIDQTSSYVGDQNEALEKSQRSIDQVLDLNAAAGENLERLLESSDASVKQIVSGQNEITGNLKDSEHAGLAMDDTIGAIGELRAFSDEISLTIEVITDIADETNLIALNAAIEAARAGEHGRGFAVVAEKIRELAEISLSNAQTINRVLKNIHQHIDKVTANAQGAKGVIVSLSESSSQLNTRFDSIRGSIDLIKDVLDEFRVEFNEESLTLADISKQLIRVKDASYILVSNANSSKELMEILVNKGGELKTLADGFEVVLNNRAAKRTIITPPIRAKMHGSHRIPEEVYLFDHSHGGISFYSTDNEGISVYSVGERGHLELETALEGKDSISYEIAYISEEELKGVFFYGAKVL